MKSIELARKARIHAVQMVHNARASHIASALSIIDIMSVLYQSTLNVFAAEPDHPGDLPLLGQNPLTRLHLEPSALS